MTARRLLIVFLTLLFLFSLPSLFHKIKTERSASAVELTVDYFSLVDLALQHDQPRDFEHDMLLELRDQGVDTLTLPNNTVSSLQSRGFLTLLDDEQVEMLNLLVDPAEQLDSDQSYIRFTETEQRDEIMALLAARFADEETEELAVNGQYLYRINLKRSSVAFASLPFLESDRERLTGDPYHFKLVPKVDNRWDDQEQLILDQLQEWGGQTISKVYFVDAGVIGFPDRHRQLIGSLPDVPFAYKEYFIPSARQKGIGALAEQRDYNMVRLHIIDSNLIANNLDTPNVLHDRIRLAVTERNIRLLHLQLPAPLNGQTPDQVFVEVSRLIASVEQTLTSEGFHFGSSEPFDDAASPFVGFSKTSAFLAGIMLISLTVHIVFGRFSFVTCLSLLVLFSSTMIFGPLPAQMIALLVAVCIPIASLVVVKECIENQRSTTVLSACALYGATALTSILGALVVVAMHSDVSYVLYLEQFRGVSVAHLLPPVLIVALLVYKEKGLTVSRLYALMKAPLRLTHLVLIVLIGAVGYYYLSRTGNGGTMIPFEAEFRSLLMEQFGVRPRTKEFLIAHPLLFILIYYWHRARFAKWLLPIAAIGQLSIVNTFTHFHTPTLISLERAFYGLGLGLLLGLLAILMVEYGLRFFAKRKNYRKRSYI